MSGSALLLRRDGALWAVAAAAVRGIEQDGGRMRVRLKGVSLAADEVVGVIGNLITSQPGQLLRRMWSEPCAGLAVVDGRPVVVVWPDDPPRALRLEERGEESDGHPNV